MNPTQYTDIETNFTALTSAVIEYIAKHHPQNVNNPASMLHHLFPEHEASSQPDTAKISSHHHHKHWYREFEGRRIQDLFDIVMALECRADAKAHPAINLKDFFEAWKPIVENIHLVIVQLGSGCEMVATVQALPSWLDYDLFTSTDIETTLKDYISIFDVRSASVSSAYVIGTLISDRDFIYYLSRDTLPVVDSNGTLINPLDEHVANLLSPASPYYYNINHDPYRYGAEFSAGYPYSLRDGVPTALSIGYVVGQQLTDAMTPGSSTGASDIATDPRRHSVITIPYGVFHSLSFTNLAINRLIAGPCLYLASMLQVR
jgi:hypothetical protein